MERKETWLDAIYNHPNRDRIIIAYIATYRGDDETLKIDNVTMDKDELGRDVLAVKCSSLYNMMGKQKERITEMLYLGEYFRYSETKPEPIYLFNEVLSLIGGKNTHHWVAILEQLNMRKAINHDTYLSYVKKESKKYLESMYEGDEEALRFRRDRLDNTMAVMQDRIKSDKHYNGLLDNFPIA